jgi:glycosyltransferase involved in cell wall biosynthesis
MINITHIITTLTTGGAERMLLKLVKHMDSSRFQNRVIALGPMGIMGERIRALGIPIYTLDMRPDLPSPLALFRLIRGLRQYQPDIIQTWMYHADLMGTIASRWVPDAVLCWNIRTASPAIVKRLTRVAIMRPCTWLSGYPDAIITNTILGQQLHVAWGYRDSNWRVIYNGFELGDWYPDLAAGVDVRRELGIPAEHRVIGMVARNHPMKNYAGFIRAALHLLEHRSNVHFIGVGPGVTFDNPDLRALIPTNLDDHFHLLGERQDVRRLVNAFDIATLTSHSEGLPNAIGEAMACGVSCVVTDAGDSAHLVGDTGIVVPIDDPAALIAGWGHLLDLPQDERRRLGLVARARIESHFAIDVIVSQYEALYNELIYKRSSQ